MIGGSIAKSLKKNSDFYVYGYDKNSDCLNDALTIGAIDSVWSLCDDIDADLTVLCLSPAYCTQFLKDNASKLKKGSVVTDVCGVKACVVSQCEAICNDFDLDFIGGHPMAGKERNGFKNSDENLFNRASYIITPTEKTSQNAIDTVKLFVKGIKAARITVTSPENHDRVIAFTSQIPHILAGAYVKSSTCQGRHGFSAGSFKDVSRVATIDEELWSELFLLNKDSLVTELQHLIDSLTEYKSAIINNDGVLLKEVIKRGRLIKEKDNKDTEKYEKGDFNA